MALTDSQLIAVYKYVLLSLLTLRAIAHFAEPVGGCYGYQKGKAINILPS